MASPDINIMSFILFFFFQLNVAFARAYIPPPLKYMYFTVIEIFTLVNLKLLK